MTFQGQHDRCVHSMFLGDDAPIAKVRETRRFPKNRLLHDSEVIAGQLHYGSTLCALATMAYKHRNLDTAPFAAALTEPNFLVRVIPYVDGTPRVCELVR